jgi:predicted ATP-dependent endonuclease of OLD family
LTDTDIDSISLVKKRENKTVICQPASAGINKAKLKKEMSVDNLELFFADKVVLVEGATEKILLPSIAFKINPSYDFDRRNISLIDVGSKSNFLIFLKLLKAYEKEWHVIIDKDILDGVSKTNLKDIASFSGVEIANLSADDIIRALKSKNIYILSYGEIENYYSKSWLYGLVENIIKDFETAHPSTIAELIEIFRRFQDPTNIDVVKRDVGTRFTAYFDKMEPILNIKKDLILLDINRPKISDNLKSIFKNIDLNSKPRIAVKIKDHADINKMDVPKREELTEIITKILA